nr:NAD(P)/FAD-dependent oxidoreductase [Bdellovibrionales bacterium]
MKIPNASNETGTKSVVIVGGGFAGLNTAKTLADHPGFKVTIIDHRNHHLFQPLLYQVATAGLNPADIAVPIRAQFAATENITVRWGEVSGVNLKDRHLICDDDEIEYDFLVLACGTQHSYFGHPEWEEFAPGLKTLEQATEIRRRILSAFERAENEPDPVKQNNLLTFIIVGGGPTGVELAGAIADISRTVLIKDFQHIDPAKAKIILVEAGSKILAPFADELSQQAAKDLKDLGVEVRTNARVMNINADGVLIGKNFESATCVFWAAGVQASKMNFTPPVHKDRLGRVTVLNDLSLENYPEVFIAGDMASFDLGDGKFLPGLAPVAMQAGIHVGKTILATQTNNERKPFHYRDKGQMATIGKNRAIMEFKDIRVGGFIAWIAWLFVHIFFLIGFKNRITVMA